MSRVKYIVFMLLLLYNINNMPSSVAEIYPQGSADSEVQFMPVADSLPYEGQKGFANAAAVERLRDVPKGTYLLLGEPFAQVSPYTVAAHFNEIGDLRLTREESNNGVLFGQLVLNNFEGEASTELVAVKPFKRPKEAAHEMGAMHAVNDLDPRRRTPLSYEPLGFYKMPDGRTALITKYDHSVRTQDTIYWNPDREPSPAEVTRALNHGAFALGSLHHYGLTHGDAQVKNVAFDTHGVRYPDLADLASHGGGNTVDPFTVRRRVEYDLRKYVTSLATKSYLGHDDYIEPVAATFAPMYTRIAGTLGSQVPQEARFQPDEIVEMMY